MDLIERIKNQYKNILEDQASESEYHVFQKLVSDCMIDKMMKCRNKSKQWFYSFTQPSKPYFVSLKKRQEFSKVTALLLNIFEKLTNTYYSHNDVKKVLSVDGQVRNYLGTNPGYSRKIPIARFDALYNFSTDALHFLEINTDIPGGMGDNDMLIKIFDCLPSMMQLKNKFEFKRDTLVNNYCNSLLKNYKEYCGNFKKRLKDNPHIAVVCARNSDIRLEVDFIISLLKKEGLNVSYADPRDFVYDGKILMLNGEEVDIISRRENIRDIFRTDSAGKLHSNIRNKVLSYSRTACLKNPFLNKYLQKGYFGHTEDLLRAYKENNICMINSFYSCIPVQKSAFALIQESSFKNLFDEEEQFIIDKYIPWTRILAEGKTFYDQKEIDLLRFVKLNRQNFVLKPNMGFGGKGIVLGTEVTQKEWEKKINQIITTRLKYVVQEYIDIPIEYFPLYENSILTGFYPQYVNINFWGIDGEFAGGLIRASDKKVINVSNGARFVPIYYAVN